MPVYLVENPPRIRQYRSPRRERPSGVVVVHTAESFPDEVGPDTGAENVARFIELRTNHGSYHDLVDSDSIIQMVRYSDEAFHDATGSNPHSYGVSAATQAAKWRELGDDWVDATVRNMARATARYATWLHEHYGIVIPARRITRAESEHRKPGFISHAERDPDRRTDPGRYFPWDDFLGYYADEMNGDDMPTVREIWYDDMIEAPPGYNDPDNPTWSPASVIRSAQLYSRIGAERGAKTLTELAAIRAAVNAEPVDVAELASELAPLLVGPIVAELGNETGITEEQAERVLRRVLGSLND